jgi:HAMP domain-containing protein/tetratricopeptide (TPR) repeat protein
MDFIYEILGNVYLNFFGFGVILACVFTSLVGLFMITLKHRSKSTARLAMVFLLMGIFNFCYIVASVWYHPLAAFHRWGTVLLILPVLTYATQWQFYFPEESHRTFRKILLYLEMVVGFAVTLFFFKATYNAPKKFHFTGHYWDFDAEKVSKIVAIVIFTYLMIFFLSGVWRTITIKTKERWAVLQITLAFMLVTLVPIVLNVMSRDGSVDRGTFLTSFVLFTVLGFFFVILIYFNITQDRTTFMAKIVGISLVTFLLLMQGLSYVTMQDREVDFDNLRKEYMGRALEGGKKHSDIQYIFELSMNSPEVNTTFENKPHNLDKALIKLDLLNTIIYEKIRNFPESEFLESTKKLLENTQEEFSPYKLAILDFMEMNADKPNSSLKISLLQFMDSLNKKTFVHSNKLSNFSNETFCDDANKYISSLKKEEAIFRDIILSHFSECKWDGKELEIADLRRTIYGYFRFLKPAGIRQYRKSLDYEIEQNHYVVFSSYFPELDTIKEVGFSYKEYRHYMHESAREQVALLFIVLFVLLTIFPYFFQGSLINPLSKLLRGVGRVNKGDLEVEVPIKVNDEIGFLSGSFNKMVESIRDARKKLEDYALNLEEKVMIRTKEVQDKMEEVQRLKIQQDGDYFLTSLLAKPLFYNANKSELVKTEFLIKQKKQFTFKNKNADLGGDICVTGNLRLGKPDNFKKYTMSMNGDAMGKSMQGAGGSLVMGVVMNSIMARSASNKRVLDLTPEQWLTNVYNEIHSVFKTFNGTMVISTTVTLIEDETGMMYYFNAEHPFTVLYRDGKASFIEDSLKLRKLGLESEYDFEVQKFQLAPGDIVILASDGRDDLDLTPDMPFRTINDDEKLFLEIVERANADVNLIESLLKSKGEITDDLSILKISFQMDLENSPILKNRNNLSTEIHSKIQEINKMYSESKKLYLSGDIYAAKEKMEAAYKMENSYPKLNKLYGLLCFKTKEYSLAANVISNFLSKESEDEEMWYYLSLSYKKLNNFEQALDAAEKAYQLSQENLNNMINLSDIYRILGNNKKAQELSEKVLSIDVDNKSARRILSAIGYESVSKTG